MHATFYTAIVLLAIGVTGHCAGDPCADFVLVPRQRWGANPATATDYQLLPVPYVVVHHTVTETCSKKSTCARIAQNVQTFHMDHLGYDDIGYK